MTNNEIEQSELQEILASYGKSSLVFDAYKPVNPDTAIYFFHDVSGVKYALVAGEFLVDYLQDQMPYNYEYDYGEPYEAVSYRAAKRLSYVNDAPKAADDANDSAHCLTQASTGDVCLLFECEN